MITSNVKKMNIRLIEDPFLQLDNFMKKIMVILLLFFIYIGHSQERSETIKSLSNRDFNIYLNFDKNYISLGSDKQLNFDSKYHLIPFYKFLIKNSHLFVFLRHIVVDLKNDFTEFYDLIYSYETDCISINLNYNKSFYKDGNLKPNESLSFLIKIIPFTELGANNLGSLIRN